MEVEGGKNDDPTSFGEYSRPGKCFEASHPLRFYNLALPIISVLLFDSNYPGCDYEISKDQRRPSLCPRSKGLWG